MSIDEFQYFYQLILYFLKFIDKNVTFLFEVWNLANYFVQQNFQVKA
jgi:hypothetical protein